MKTNIKIPFLLPALIAALNLLPAGRVTAQTFTTLHSFTATSTNLSGVYTNSDGANPYAGLITNSSGKTLYGTTSGGGSSGNGTVFAVNTDGTGFTNLHSFSGDSDGAYPYAGLILSGNTLYGTASEGGSSGVGTVFAINTDGSGFTNLHNFIGSDGGYPYAGLILSDNTLYGTAQDGGGYQGAEGSVFAVNTNGTGFTNLDIFFGPNGAGPQAGLVLVAGFVLYGTTVGGGSSGNGTVFSISLPPLPPVEQINGLIALVQSLGLPSGTAKSLVVKLQDAANALDTENTEAACSKLGAFLQEVNAQTGKKLTAAQADLLIAEATRIRTVLGCR